ncbi:hypothetical protein BDW22DRAFT_224528 [Trametopsis cervina]|nr:hypothetical protein BDW22DRAFT_224528 [Trametopsis cervina]
MCRRACRRSVHRTRIRTQPSPAQTASSTGHQRRRTPWQRRRIRSQGLHGVSGRASPQRRQPLVAACRGRALPRPPARRVEESSGPQSTLLLI